MFGADQRACLELTFPFVEEVLAAESVGNRLTTCEVGLARADCDALFGGDLRRPGGYCADDVLAGATPPPMELITGTCTSIDP